MRIEKATPTDLPGINEFIKRDFPYVERNPEKLREKIADGTIEIFKATEGKKVLGFVEVQFLEQGIARINGLSVREDAREKGIGKDLLGFAIDFLKKKNTARILLLVKRSNQKAKAIYAQAGFQFIGLYHRKIDNASVEEMELDLKQETPDYVS